MSPSFSMSSPSASSRDDSPWPAQTALSPGPSSPPPLPSSPPSALPAKRKRDPRALDTRPTKRQVIVDQTTVAWAEQQCQWYSGNDVISCFPEADTIVPQHQWITFVWNSRRPEITQNNLVDIFLFQADSRQVVKQWLNVINPSNQAGVITYQVNDTWWGERGANWAGQNVTYPFYFVLTRADTGLDGSEIPQATFSAVQTTLADFVVASSSSAAAASSASAASAARTPTPSGASRTGSGSGAFPTATDGSGSIQSGAGGSSFPHWAIAVIVILGFFAIVCGGVLGFVIMRRLRDRRFSEASSRNSTNSAAPLNKQVVEPQSPVMAEAGSVPGSATTAGFFGAGTAAGAVAGAGAASSLHHRPSVGDGASTISRTQSDGAAPFSGADAAIMADAFRKALRKPGMVGGPEFEEGESPESAHERAEAALLSQHLAEEGRDLRSVASSRGVKVENAKDGEDDGSTWDGH